MTTDERFERIEHVTAALAEERRNDREEYRQLWRDTHRQIQELTLSIADFRSSTDAAIAGTNAAIAETNAAIRAEIERAKGSEPELRNRVDSLVSAIGLFIPRLPPPQ